jgi:hypothetical protein
MLGLKAISSFRDEKNSNLCGLLRHFPVIAEKFLATGKNVFLVLSDRYRDPNSCVLARQRNRVSPAIAQAEKTSPSEKRTLKLIWEK